MLKVQTLGMAKIRLRSCIDEKAKVRQGFFSICCNKVLLEFYSVENAKTKYGWGFIFFKC